MDILLNLRASNGKFIDVSNYANTFSYENVAFSKTGGYLNKGSMYFDGSAYIKKNKGVGADLKIANGQDFCLAYRFNYTRAIDTYNSTFLSGGTYNSNGYFAQSAFNRAANDLDLGGDNSILIRSSGDNTATRTCDGKWHSCLINRKSNVAKIFIDGVLKNTTTNADSISFEYTNFNVGKIISNVDPGQVPGQGWYGYLDDILLVKDASLYDASYLDGAMYLIDMKLLSLAYKDKLDSLYGYK